jgi:hypothetical protein
MPQERSTFLGIGTDAPPDRLGDQAMRVKNVIPASPSSIKPRLGVSKSAEYDAHVLGRMVVVDALPDSGGTGVLVTCLNITDAGAGDGSVDTQVDGLGAFYPPLLAARYQTISGLNLSQVLFGVTN